MYAMVPIAVPGLVRCSALDSMVACDIPAAAPPNGATHGGNFRQSKVKNFGIATFRDEDVCRLDVAVNDPSGVSRVQCIGDLDSEREEDFHFQRTPSDSVL